MALEKIGLGGVLTFDEKQAVRGMERATGVAARFSKTFNRITSVASAVGRATGQMAGSLRNLGLASLPATAAVGFATKQAVDFEKQMSAVKAITGATSEQMERLTREAKKQGATTAFSATEAAQGMEFLSRAGFDVDQQIAALGPTLNAAASDGIDLATAADIVANTLKGLNLPAEDAGRAADVLALTSARTNTNLIGMGEAMKFAAPQAKTLGIELETTAAILGATADAGLRGTIGGTSFTQALVKLTKPTSEGEAILKKFNVQMTKTETGGLDVVDVFKQINTSLKSIPDVVERARVQTELFGIRGQKAFAAAATAIDTGKLDTLVDQLNNAEGAAERMAKTRLDNVAGAFTLLRSAAEGFALETAGLFLGPMAQGVQSFTSVLSDTVLVLQELNSEQGLTEETANKAGPTIVAVAKGIKEGIETVIDAWVSFRTQVTNFIKEFTGEQNPEVLQGFVKMATVIGLVLAAIAPVLIAIGGIAFFVTTVIIPAFTAIGTVVGAVFGGAVLPVLALAAAGFFLIRREGESVGQTFIRIKDMAINAFNFIMEAAVQPFIDGFLSMEEVFGFVQEKFNDFTFFMRSNFGDVINAIVQAATFLKPIFVAVFGFLGKVVSGTLGLAFAGLLDVVQGFSTFARNVFISIVESMVNFVKGAASLAVKFGDLVGFDVSEGLREFAAGEFRVKVGVERGIGAGEGAGPGEPAPIDDIAASLSDLTAQTQAEGQVFTPGSVEEIKNAVAGAIAEQKPPDLCVETSVQVDGAEIARATGKHQQEVRERTGNKAVPWQRKVASSQGVAPTGSVRGS